MPADTGQIHEGASTRPAHAEQPPTTIWVVSELYYPEETSTGYILTKIAEGLAAHFPVNVLCSQPTYELRGTRAPGCERRNGAQVRRCPSATLDKDKPLFRAINMVTFCLSAGCSALRRLRPQDVVIVVTNPPLLPFLIAAACRARRARLLLLVHDVYPEALVAAGALRPGGLIERLVSATTRSLYRRTTRIITLGRAMRELVITKCPEVADRTVMIPNWADLHLVRPMVPEHSPLLHELGLAGRFIVQHAGNMGRTHSIAELVHAAERLRDHVHFLFIGSGAQRGWLEETVAARRLPNLTVLATRPRSDSQNFLSACHVAVISFVSGMAGVSVPSRLYNVLAAGRPVLAMADASSDLATVVTDEELGWVVPPGDVEGLVRALDEARTQPDRLRTMGENARRVAEEQYPFSRILAQYVDLIRGVASPTPTGS